MFYFFFLFLTTYIFDDTTRDLHDFPKTMQLVKQFLALPKVPTLAVVNVTTLAPT